MARWWYDGYEMTDRQESAVLGVIGWHRSRDVEVSGQSWYRVSGKVRGRERTTDHLVLQDNRGRVKDYYWNTGKGRWATQMASTSCAYPCGWHIPRKGEHPWHE